MASWVEGQAVHGESTLASDASVEDAIDLAADSNNLATISLKLTASGDPCRVVVELLASTDNGTTYDTSASPENTFAYDIEEGEVRIVTVTTIFPRVYTFFIWGFPFETMEDFHQSVFMMVSFRLMGARILPSLLALLPQTDIYEEYRDDPRLEFSTQLMPEYMLTGHEICHFGRISLPEEHKPLFQFVADNRDIFPGFFLYDVKNNIWPKYRVLQEHGFYTQERLENVDVVVEDEPTRSQLRKSRVRRNETLLGLYEGIPRTRRDTGYGLVLPDKISIFQKPIEEKCRGEDEITREVERVVRHEIAHHFGIGDDTLRKIESRKTRRKQLRN